MKTSAPYMIHDRLPVIPDGFALKSEPRGDAVQMLDLNNAGLLTLFEHSLMGVVIIQNGRFAYVNTRLADLLGYDREELANDHAVLDVVHPDDREMIYERIRHRLSGKKQETEYRFRCLHRTGRTVHVEAHSSPTAFKGSPAVISSVLDVTEQLATLERLRESEKRFRHLAENARDFIFRYRLKPDREFEYVSAAATRTTGYTPGEFYRSPNLIVKLVHPADRKLLRRLYDDEGYSNEPLIMRLRRKDGSMIWTEQQLTPVRNDAGKIVAVEGIGRDITQRIEAQENGRLLTAAIEAAANAVVISDTDGNIQWVNPAFETLTGWSPDEAVGNSTRLLKSGQHDDRFYKGLWSAIKDGRVWNGQLVNRRKDGSEYNEEMTITPVTDRSDRIANFIAVKQDVTDRVRYEKGLIEARRNAEEMARTKNTLLNNISHELRTPLTAILGYSQLLVEEVPENVLELAEEVYNGGIRLQETFDSVLDLARLEANQVEIGPEPVNVVDEVRTLLHTFRPKIEQKGLDVEVSGSETPVFLDRVILGRILTNLLSNAVKFTDEGRIQIEVTTRLNGVLFRVSDTGQGISNDFLPHLYEEFRQESDGLSRSHVGIGLGMNIVHRLVDLHGGTIDVSSQKGCGTTFTVWLPESTTNG